MERFGLVEFHGASGAEMIAQPESPLKKEFYFLEVTFLKRTDWQN